MRAPRIISGLLLGLCGLAGGCNIISALAYFFGPPQIQKAEFKLTGGRLAVLVEAARPEQENPVFTQALCQKLGEILREHGVKAQLIPQEDVFSLRQQNPDFATWSVQKVGQRLNADQVLYIRIEHLQIHPPGSPLLEPAVSMRLKVIAPDRPPEAARLWPSLAEPEGRQVQRSRPAVVAGDALTLDSEAAKLGKDAAWLVAAPFYDVDLEKKTPWEP